MSDVYLRAAELLDKSKDLWSANRFSCIAVDAAVKWGSDHSHSPQANSYRKTFARGETELQHKFMSCDDPHQCRVLALLFMHWISKEKS